MTEWSAGRRSAGRYRRARAIAMLLAAAASLALPRDSVGVENGDILCDVAQSTLLTCVIVGTKTVADETSLHFSRRNVRIDGTITVTPAGRCALSDQTSCVSDQDCGALAPCLRPRRLEIVVADVLTVDRQGRILARGDAVTGDLTGSDGGSVTLVAGTVDIAGILDVSAAGRPGVKAGAGGTLVINATGSVAARTTARLDASTSTGGCGGSIIVGDTLVPGTIDLHGDATAEGATLGGRMRLEARDGIVIGGVLEASNTSSDVVGRAPCSDGTGGGYIRLSASRIEVNGRAQARGREGGGGQLHFIAQRELMVDSLETPPAFSVFGGDIDAFTTGGEIRLIATAGDVTLRRGRVEADGQTSGLGADAGRFEVLAYHGTRCRQSGAACASDRDCPPSDRCAEQGGNVVVESPLSARGGSGGGFGCNECAIAGTRDVTLTAPIAVDGGAQTGAGGALEVVAGGRLVVGPSPITASGADGGLIDLVAGDRAGGAHDTGGDLRLAGGGQVRAEGLVPDGLGGEINVRACSVLLQASARLTVAGGTSNGSGGRLLITARGELQIDSLATFVATPQGEIGAAYGTVATVAPDATFNPPAVPQTDPTLSPCPTCGDSIVEHPELCDGLGSCSVAGEVCVSPGGVGQCTCADSCGDVPGIQGGEECDGNDLGGRTCQSEGFLGGTLRCSPSCSLDTTGCQPTVCGNGVPEAGEDCDDGNEDEHDGCRGNCRLARCGDGILCTGDGCTTGPGGGVEECDDGNGDDHDACPRTCRPATCGDGFVCSGPTCTTGPNGGAEECDDPSICCLGSCAVRQCPDSLACDNANGCCHPDASCDDGDLCTTDVCNAFVGCVNATVVDCCAADEVCDDHNPCTDDRCGDGRRCVFTPNAAPCDDGNRCTRADVCRVGNCVGGDPVLCPARDQCHDVGVCDPTSGSCLVPLRPDGSVCSDGNACTVDDVCRTGACVGGLARDCDDGLPCTADACETARGCVHTALTGCCDANVDCDDGDACTGVETCDVATGTCEPGSPPVCNDGDACTSDGCTPEDGCASEPVDLTTVRAAIAQSIEARVCDGEPVAAVMKLLDRANKLLDRAERAPTPNAVRRRILQTARALKKAAKRATKSTGQPISTDCAGVLDAGIGDARTLTLCITTGAAPG
jgi:cysteine-rich repeat protein